MGDDVTTSQEAGERAQDYPPEWEADVLLADGTPVRVRPILPADGPALRRFHRALSARTVYFRFFTAYPELSDADVLRFTRVDHVARVALVALAHGDIAAVGRFDALGDGSAEVAFVVRDDLQGTGLGSILLEHLAAAGREVGVDRFVAEVLPANSRMLATFREAGFAVDARRHEDVIAVEFSIADTPASRTVREAREHRAERRSVERLLRPTGVVVVGATGPLAAMAGLVAADIVAAGFDGPIGVVGIPAPPGAVAVPTIAEVDARTQIAYVAVEPASLPGVVEELGARGLHGVVVASASTEPNEPTWPEHQARLVERARATGLRIVGPNALGLINTAPDVRLNASPLPTLPPRGGIGLFCQSAAIGRSLVGRLVGRGLGISTFVSAGNRADVSGNDLLQYWADDEQTTVALLYLESIGNARKFARLVRSVAQRKVVAIVRAGGADAHHPLGHAVARTELPDAAVEQILADCGLISVDRVSDLLDVAAIAACQPLPGAGPAHVVANSDALATLARNALAAAGLGSGRPPTVLARTAGRDEISRAVADAGRTAGLVLVAHVPAAESTGQETAGPWPAQVPVVAVLPDAAGRAVPPSVPVFVDLEDAAVALAHLARLAAWRRSHDGPLKVQSVAPAPARPVSVAAGSYHGQGLARVLADAGLVPLVRLADAPAGGWRVRVRTDPLYGPVVSVGVDDSVAEALGDRSWRLAPVDPEGARRMVLATGACSVLAPGLAADPAVGPLAAALAAVSRWFVDVPGLTDVELRHARVVDADLLVSAAIAQVAAEPVSVEPEARRLRSVPVAAGGTMPP